MFYCCPLHPVGNCGNITKTNKELRHMKLRQIASNQTELTLPCGAVVLFSYETPVAAQLASGSYVRTEQKWSVTTSRHINKWLQGIDAQEVPQADLYNLTGEAV